MDQMFRMIYILVGLRPQFTPNDLELVVLYQFVQEEYGNHTADEILLAFKMVAKGEVVDGDGKVIELYDYFTPAFFGKVIKAYRKLVLDIGNRVADKKYIENLKEFDIKLLGDSSTSQFDWRAVIEKDYQFFLSTDDDLSDTFPEEHYRILVEDDLIKEDFWQKKLTPVKNKILQKLNAAFTALQHSDLEKQDRFMRFNQVKKELEEYKEGQRDADFILAAKQSVIAAFFRYNRDLGNKNIYIPKVNLDS
jgi:hypothetical protein